MAISVSCSPLYQGRYNSQKVPCKINKHQPKPKQDNQLSKLRLNIIQQLRKPKKLVFSFDLEKNKIRR